MTIARRIRLAVIVTVLGALITTVAVLWQSGYRAYILHTNSMSPALKSGDLVIDRPAHAVHAGEVITFRHSGLSTDVVTHRVTDVTAGVIHTKGDGNPTADSWDIRPNQVRGVMALHLPRAGYVVVFLRQPTGVASVVTGTLALTILWSLFFPAADPRPRRSAMHRAVRPDPAPVCEPGS